MSNSFLPKKAPNVFNQETLERALVILRQPFSIAVLASLGLHGLLWAALPNILAETAKEADTKQRVQVVELSPAEQSQLPSLGINPVSPTLAPTKPVPPATSGDKLPDPNKFYSSPLDTIPVFPPMNPYPTYPDDLSSLFPKSFPEPKKEPKKQTNTPDKAKVPPPPSPNPKASEPAKPANPGGQDGKVDESRAKTLSPEQLALLQKDAERSRQFRSLYTFNGPTTQDKALEVAQTNLSTFQEVAMKVINGGAYDDTRFTKNPEKVANLFPKEACPYVGGVRNASFGAIVKPDGTLAESPIVLLPSGYKGLDDAAIEDISSVIKNKKLGESDKFRLIRFDYVFDPKVSCPNPSKAT